MLCAAVAFCSNLSQSFMLQCLTSPGQGWTGWIPGKFDFCLPCHSWVYPIMSLLSSVPHLWIYSDSLFLFSLPCLGFPLLWLSPVSSLCSSCHFQHLLTSNYCILPHDWEVNQIEQKQKRQQTKKQADSAEEKLMKLGKMEVRKYQEL